MVSKNLSESLRRMELEFDKKLQLISSIKNDKGLLNEIIPNLPQDSKSPVKPFGDKPIDFESKDIFKRVKRFFNNIF